MIKNCNFHFLILKMSLKKVIKVVLLIFFLLLLAPSFIILNRIRNDYVLREYVKETFLFQLKNDLSRFFTYNLGEESKIKTLNIEFQHIVGVSGGSIISSLYCTGMPLDDIKKLAIETNFKQFRGFSLKIISIG